METVNYVCDISALDSKKKVRYPELFSQLQPLVRSIDELKKGYAITFGINESDFALISEWVVMDRLCCPFLDFSIDWKSGEDQVLVSITGPDEDAKPFIKAEMAFS